MDRVHAPTRVHIGFGLRATFTCSQCGAEGEYYDNLFRGCEMEVRLPAGWTSYQGEAICPRHRVMVITWDDRTTEQHIETMATGGHALRWAGERWIIPG